MGLIDIVKKTAALGLMTLASCSLRYTFVDSSEIIKEIKQRQKQAVLSISGYKVFKEDHWDKMLEKKEKELKIIREKNKEKAAVLISEPWGPEYALIPFKDVYLSRVASALDCEVDCYMNADKDILKEVLKRGYKHIVINSHGTWNSIHLSDDLIHESNLEDMVKVENIPKIKGYLIKHTCGSIPYKKGYDDQTLDRALEKINDRYDLIEIRSSSLLKEFHGINPLLRIDPSKNIKKFENYKKEISKLTGRLGSNLLEMDPEIREVCASYFNRLLRFQIRDKMFKIIKDDDMKKYLETYKKDLMKIIGKIEQEYNSDKKRVFEYDIHSISFIKKRFFNIGLSSAYDVSKYPAIFNSTRSYKGQSDSYDHDIRTSINPRISEEMAEKVRKEYTEILKKHKMRPFFRKPFGTAIVDDPEKVRCWDRTSWYIPDFLFNTLGNSPKEIRESYKEYEKKRFDSR